MFIEKEFMSEGSILRGRWYSAEDPKKCPLYIDVSWDFCDGSDGAI